MAAGSNVIDLGRLPSTSESLASISQGIDNLESFLNELTNTLLAQNQEMETLTREREAYFGPIISTSSDTLITTPEINEQNDDSSNNRLRPSRLQMGRELGPPIMNIVEANVQMMAPQESRADFFRQVNQFQCNRTEYTPGVNLDYNVQFGSGATVPITNGATNPVGATVYNATPVSTNSLQNSSMLLEVMKRAAEAASDAGDAAGFVELEQFQRDLTNTLHRGMGLIQNITSQQENGDTESNDPLGLTETESSGDSSDSDFDMEQMWDRSSSSLFAVNQDLEIFSSGSEETDSSEGEDNLVFIGARTIDELYNIPANDNNVEVGEHIHRDLEDGRRPGNRNVSPSTLEFYQRIGIRIAEGDSAELRNGFLDTLTMPCPKTIFSSEGSVEPEIKEPLLDEVPTAQVSVDTEKSKIVPDTSDESNDVVEKSNLQTTIILSQMPPYLIQNEFLTAQVSVDIENSNIVPDTSEESRDVVEKSNLQTTVLLPQISPYLIQTENLKKPSLEPDKEDEELERLIQDFRRKKLENNIEGSPVQKESSNPISEVESTTSRPSQSAGAESTNSSMSAKRKVEVHLCKKKNMALATGKTKFEPKENEESTSSSGELKVRQLIEVTKSKIKRKLTNKKD